MDEFKTQLKKGTIELLILALLNKKNTYGREFIEILHNNNIEVTEGTIYPLLARLKTLNYVQSYLEESTQGGTRKYYVITQKGREYYAHIEKELKEYFNNINKIINK